jgi:hypothetical protein
VYFDNILIYSKTEEEHYAHLTVALELLRKHGLKAKAKKCGFFNPELKFLGHIISADGLKSDPCKVETVVKWPVPQPLMTLEHV